MTDFTPAQPFPGLRPFRYEESQLFFGRDGQVEKMLAKLSAKHFLGVVGTSGSGKSSLVFAGLLPALRSGMMPGAGSNWRIAVLRPGDNPIGNLARALNDPKVFGPAETAYRSVQTAVTEAMLRRGSRGLAETARQNTLPGDPTKNLLVIVDQFEELFRYAREARRAHNTTYDDDAAAFVKLLLEAVRPTATGEYEQHLYVLLTMRSDFLGDCAQFWDLPEAINESQYLIPRLTREQMREVIEGPVALCQAHITTRLVNHLLNDIGDRQDQLPILQHALMRTWDYWKAKCRMQNAESSNAAAPTSATAPTANAATISPSIDLPHYEAVGGLEHALSLHADEAFGELKKKQEHIAKKVFQCLTEKGEDNREIRRPVEMQALCAVAEADLAAVAQVIETFRAPGRSFLMPPREDTPALLPATRIDISHESLIRVWQRLHVWVNEEATAAASYRRLADVAARRKTGKAEVLSGVDLDTALQWQADNHPTVSWAARYPGNFADVLSLLADSQAERAANEAKQRAEAEEKEAQRRAAAVAAERQRHSEREIARTRRFAMILGAAFLLAAALAVFSYLQRREAERQRLFAETQRAEAVRQQQLVEKSDRLYSQITPILNEILFFGNNPSLGSERALEFFQQSGNVLGEIVTLCSLGDTYLRLFAYQEAAEHYQQAFQQLSQRLPGHPYAAHVLNRLGTVATQKADYARAEQAFNQAYAVLRQSFGPDHIEVSANRSGLGLVYQRQNKFAEAEKLFKEAVEINARVLGTDHPQLAVDEEYLATLYAAWNKPDLAEPLFVHARQSLEAKIGKANLRDKEQLDNYSFLFNSLASLCVNHGSLYAKQQQFDKAEPLLNRALEIHEHLLGPNHPKVAVDVNNLASLYLLQHKYAEAVRLYERALPVYAATYGKDNERTGRVRADLETAKAGLAQAGKDRR